MINFFVNFFLLEITAAFTKKQKNIWKLIISSLIGAIYSLVIFVDNINWFVLFASKLVVSSVIVFVAFEYHRLSNYLKCFFIFYFSSIILLGFMVLATFVLKLGFVSVNNSVMYFNLSSSTIIVSALVAYLLSSLIIRLHNRSLSKNEIYMLTIIQNDKEYNLYAFLDTGNKLREPFSNNPVIVVDKSRLNIEIDSSKIRLIPTSTVSGYGMLEAFIPDKLLLKTSNKTEEIENVYIALSNDITDKDYSAILHKDILSI